jgi:phosphopantothenoylcysteine decarboxylase / phosphopantothenate---cysteine ligase
MRVAAIDGKRIVLGVTGSIAAYKAADLASSLAQAGAQVDTILTDSAARFVSPLTFQSVTGRRAYTDADLWGPEAHVLHVGLGQHAHLIVVAPATADVLARFANGAAGDLLSLTVLAARCPLVVAPAMDAGMFDHPATQQNLRVLTERGVRVIGPEEGHLASGLIGKGRMTEPAALFGQIRFLLSRGGPLAKRTVVVTAGGTEEPLDPVRVLTNRSSGKQGFALAQAALDDGADVILIAAATTLATPIGARRVDVRTAADMDAAVAEACRDADVLLMAAAVADFRPAGRAGQKIKKRDGVPPVILEPVPDILAGVARRRDGAGHPHVMVGFAAETEHLVEHAQDKLRAKGLTMIVANDVSAPDAGFGVDTNRVTLIGADGSVEPLPLMTKADVATRVVRRITGLLPVRR